MEIRHLKTLMMVASARSISKASHMLHLSQPSVTRIVQEIENIVGSPLFLRTKDGMILTNDGKKFYKLATKIISSIHEAISDLKNSHKKCVINIGFCPSIMIFDLIEQLRYANFRMDYIRFHEFNAKRQLIALKNNHIDISITRGADTDNCDGLEQITLHKAELFAVIPAAHRLSGKKMLNLGELKDDQFVVLSEKFFPFYSSTLAAMCKMQDSRRSSALEQMDTLPHWQPSQQDHMWGFFHAVLSIQSYLATCIFQYAPVIISLIYPAIYGKAKTEKKSLTSYQ